MKKQLNVDQITSELTGGSAFFPGYKKATVSPAVPKREEETPQPVKKDPVTAPSIDPVPPVRVVLGVPPVRDVPLVLPVPPTSSAPKKRVMKQRHPFDIYQDQYEALQELAIEERKLGGIGSMSAMVREAIDKLIAERRGTKK